MPEKFNVSRKNATGCVASGFGIGTDIEAARCLDSAVFGKNENNNDMGCQILSEMITKCKEKNDGFNDCNDLLKMFSNKCLSN